MREIKKLFEKKEEHYYKPVRVGNCFSNNYIKYESNGVRKKKYQLKNASTKLDHTQNTS